MEVRQLTPADTDIFFELRLHGLQESPDSFMIDYDQELKQGIEYFSNLIEQENPDNLLFGFFMDDKIHGIIGIYRDQFRKINHRMNVWGMYVHPEVRRNGIAKAMLKKIIDHAKKQEGISKVRLSVTSNNEKAINLYEKFGFVKWGIEPGAVQGTSSLLDEVTLSLSL